MGREVELRNIGTMARFKTPGIVGIDVPTVTRLSGSTRRNGSLSRDSEVLLVPYYHSLPIFWIDIVAKLCKYGALLAKICIRELRSIGSS